MSDVGGGRRLGVVRQPDGAGGGRAAGGRRRGRHGRARRVRGAARAGRGLELPLLQCGRRFARAHAHAALRRAAPRGATPAASHQPRQSVSLANR